MTETKKKILIVEDESSIRELFVETLSSNGFECLSASNGLEGLNLSLTAKPDVILLDLRMPEMDGLAMLKELRKKDEGSNIPVIILSTVNDEKSVSEALQWGVSDFLEKSSWNVDELLERIRSKFDNK